MSSSTADVKGVQKHLDQWKHNRAFARTIDANYRDWQINVIFYTALHLIDAALLSLSVRVTEHAGRNQQVRENETFAPVRSQYLNLYRISRITRYDADPDRWLPKEFLSVNDLVENLLSPIEASMGPLINKVVKFDPVAQSHDVTPPTAPPASTHGRP